MIPKMQMYDVTVLADDYKTQLVDKIVFAQDEEDAIEQILTELDENHVSYSICMAEEIE